MNSKICIRSVIAILLGVPFLKPAMGQIADPTVLAFSAISHQTTTLALSESTQPSTIYYTTDGTNPTAASATIGNGSSILISQNATLKVQAYQGTTSSNVVAAKYSNSGMVSAGLRHSLILKNDGTVWATGDNTYGELGNGDSTGAMKVYPVQAMESSTIALTGVVSIAAGTDESFAVDANGNVWAWGYNPNGQLGLGTTTNTLYATQITTLTNALSVASSQYHTLALLANGTVSAWGSNSIGQVGNGTTSTWVTQPTPVVATAGVSGNLSGIVAIAAGTNHSLALDTTGRVWAWGSNSSGQLGNADSTLASQSFPVLVLNNGVALSNAIGISASSTNGFALLQNGAVWGWGDNSSGELGNGTTTSSLSAVQVSGLTTSMTALGSECAVDPSGNVWTWGDNTNGELGIGYTGYYASLPLEVNPLATSFPTLSSTGSGQTVTDGTLGGPFTITAKNGTTPLSGAWVNLIVAPSNGVLGLSPTTTLFSPIIGGTTDSNGQIKFYLGGSGTGTVSLTAVSGTSQSLLTAIESAAQTLASDTPTLPQWGLILMTCLLIWFAVRPGIRRVTDRQTSST